MDRSSDSSSSSLEIIDHEDIVEDLRDALLDDPAYKEQLIGSVVCSTEALTTSQYSQVVFEDVHDVYTRDADIIVRFEYQGGNVNPDAQVGIFRTPYLEPLDFLCRGSVKQLENGRGEVRFQVDDLPNEPDFYQFQYMKEGNDEIVGASVPWQLRPAGLEKQENTKPQAENSCLDIVKENELKETEPKIEVEKDTTVREDPTEDMTEKETAVKARNPIAENTDTEANENKIFINPRIFEGDSSAIAPRFTSGNVEPRIVYKEIEETKEYPHDEGFEQLTENLMTRMAEGSDSRLDVICIAEQIKSLNAKFPSRTAEVLEKILVEVGKNQLCRDVVLSVFNLVKGMQLEDGTKVEDLVKNFMDGDGANSVAESDVIAESYVISDSGISSVSDSVVTVEGGSITDSVASSSSSSTTNVDSSLVMVLSTLGSNLESSERLLKNKTAECSNLYKQLDELKRKETSLTKRTTELEDLLSIFKEEKSVLLNKIARLEEEKAALLKTLEAKDSSILVLEEECRSLSVKIRNVDCESLQKTESIIDQTNNRINEIEANAKISQAALAETQEELQQTELEKLKLQGIVDSLRGKLDDFTLALHREVDKRASLMDSHELLQKDFEALKSSKEALKRELDESSLMLDAAQLSKEAAASEISGLEEQIKLLKTELETRSQQTRAETLQKSGQNLSSADSDVASVLSQLGGKLEAANKRIQDLESKREEQAIGVVEIHEAALRDADSNVTKLTTENWHLKKEIQRLEDQVRNLLAEKLTSEQKRQHDADEHQRQLKEHQQRLQTGAIEYRKLAQIRKDQETDIARLKQEIGVLQATEGRCSITRAGSISNPSGGESADTSLISDLMSVESSDENLKSLVIEAEIQRFCQPKHPSLNHVASSKPVEPEGASGYSEGIPELRKKAPARYSFSSEGKSSMTPCLLCGDCFSEDQGHVCQEDEPLKCSQCPKTFAQIRGAGSLEEHVKSHAMLECPICFKNWPKEETKDLERHVQTHFRESSSTRMFFARY